MFGSLDMILLSKGFVGSLDRILVHKGFLGSLDRILVNKDFEWDLVWGSFKDFGTYTNVTPSLILYFNEFH